jgi:hypothetical protein
MPERPGFHNSRFYKRHPEKRPPEPSQVKTAPLASLPHEQGIEIVRVGQRSIDFIEHSLFILVAGIVGGLLAGLLYTPAFVICGACIVLAFHRTKVVAGTSYLIQVPSYLALFATVTLSLLWVRNLALRKLAEENTAFAQLVASIVVSKIPASPVPTVTTVVAPKQIPDVRMKEIEELQQFIGDRDENDLR